ncbi:alpha/beta fold hydrolase [Actinocorallia sp. A-T 12471]|uniref:alpha/beta fold hydrolase n=1 Tax=Actinocorallia sp. A-T 12471 TaxID=3089813 RepID=UPI0029CE8146|nr:alpha/beta fold hydrolase [Actinocorallia sp. A-T 12471]MDX6739692.1 alpha/beta fold hydrolase [Actinocorallia sp. A-T 12471]
MMESAITQDLYWTESGAGEPVFLLHGGFLDHRMWDGQVPALAADHRVIAPDARGHGRSANASGPFRHVDDVAALACRLGTGPAVFVGVSMGASTAVDLALEYPELVKAVVVSGAGTSEPAFADPWTLGVLGRWHAAMSVGDLDGSVEAFLSFAAGPHRRLDALDPAVVGRLRTMALGTMSKHTPGEPDYLRPVHDTWTRVAGIAVPVLALSGALDSPDHLAMSDRLIAAVPDGRSHPIPDAAHYPNLEHPALFTDLLRAYLASL